MPMERQAVNPQHVINVLISGQASRGAHLAATQHIQRYLFLPKGSGFALDIPSGTGYGCAILHAKGYDVTGVDYDPVSVANSRVSYAGREFIRANAEQWEPEKHYALGVSFEGLEHLKDPWAMAKRMATWADQWFVSVPVNCPNEFHLHVFPKLDDVRAMLLTGFANAEWISPPNFWRCWGAR